MDVTVDGSCERLVHFLQTFLPVPSHGICAKKFFAPRLGIQLCVKSAVSVVECVACGVRKPYPGTKNEIRRRYTFPAMLSAYFSDWFLRQRTFFLFELTFWQRFLEVCATRDSLPLSACLTLQLLALLGRRSLSHYFRALCCPV